MSDTAYVAPRGAIVVSFLTSLVGLGLGIYLTIAHYEGSKILACSSTGVVNCEAVTTSAQSHFLGVPVALLGLGNFIVLTVLMSPWAWRSTQRLVHLARFGLVMISMVFVLWLIYAELILIDHICLYCTAVHVVTFILFVLMVQIGPRQLGWVASPTAEDNA